MLNLRIGPSLPTTQFFRRWILERRNVFSDKFTDKVRETAREREGRTNKWEVKEGLNI